jgi:hypothetical protein
VFHPKIKLCFFLLRVSYCHVFPYLKVKIEEIEWVLALLTFKFSLALASKDCHLRSSKKIYSTPPNTKFRRKIDWNLMCKKCFLIHSLNNRSVLDCFANKLLFNELSKRREIYLDKQIRKLKIANSILHHHLISILVFFISSSSPSA